MDMPHTKLRQKYIDEIKVIEANIKDIASGEAPQALYEHSQNKLDKLAEHFQYDEQLGTARYKLYELQALLYYFQNRDDDALAFILQAVEIKGSSYKRAEQLIAQIDSAPAESHNWDNYLDHNETPAITRANSNQRVVFFHKSPLTVALLSFISLGLYSIYWSYKHWKIIQDSKGNKPAYTGWWHWGGKFSENKRTYPVWAAIFQLFSIYPLFKLIKITAQESGYEKFRKTKFTATGYIILSAAVNATWRAEPKTTTDFVTFIIFMVLMGACIAVILAIVQRAANAQNISVLGKRHKFKSVFVGEVIFTIIAVGFSVLAIIGTYSSVGTVGYEGLSNEAMGAYQRMESLRSQYNACSSDLDARRDNVNIYSDYEVDSFNSDLEDCENTRLRLNSTVDEYNRLAGYE